MSPLVLATSLPCGLGLCPPSRHSGTCPLNCMATNLTLHSRGISLYSKICLTASSLSMKSSCVDYHYTPDLNLDIEIVSSIFRPLLSMATSRTSRWWQGFTLLPFESSSSLWLECALLATRLARYCMIICKCSSIVLNRLSIVSMCLSKSFHRTPATHLRTLPHPLRLIVKE